MTTFDYIDLLEKPISQQTKAVKHYERIIYFIVQIGTGATGSEVVRQLSQILSTSQAEHVYILADPDTIAEKNIRNQIFLSEEVNELKAEVLVERYSAAYSNLNMFSYTEGYVETVEDVQKLLNPHYLKNISISRNDLLLPIIIGCVDNMYSRKILASAFKRLPYGIYLDVGNESIVVPKDWTERPNRALWSIEEIESYNNSGWTGQVVCGVNLHKYQQPCIVDSLLIDEAELIRPSSISCQDLAASDPQRTIVNRFSAMALLSYLSEIIEEQRITSHTTFFHAKSKYMRSDCYIALEDM